MSVTMLDSSSWTAAERQAAARDAYRASGYRLSGAELRWRELLGWVMSPVGRPR